MDIIDHCEISCNFVSSKKKREALKRKLEDIRIYAGEEGVAEVCKALNYVCEKPSIWSCLQCYDKNSGEYITNQCFSLCDSKARRSFCFSTRSLSILVVIAEVDQGKVTVITFFQISKSKHFTTKCGNKLVADLSYY